MRETLRDPSRLRHILQAIDNINEYMADKGEEDLESNSMLFYAVVKNIEIIGEATYKLLMNLQKHTQKLPGGRLLQ